ncbi:(d)CMP kinase [Oleisolibacter albus]|uniref:(d)CMP kinase n=1 Tax=Oleisolibacter albus TaxID=2171757 RepID=UPI000DF149BF|nr:(d)CMP kinase [Oleisolibacter albus]
MSLVIAIDGPAASGKGTLARRIAATLGFAHLDTGGLYRAVGLVRLRQGGDPADAVAAAVAARSLTPDSIGTLTADPALRADETARAASVVSAVPAVRAALLDFQRDFARTPPAGAAGAVLDGRDIGTVVCPDAPAKLFVTATTEVRAERRLKELLGRGIGAIYADVLKDMLDRDARDSQRAVAPLVPAADAFLLDTSSLDAEQAFDAAMTFIRSRPGFSGR